MASFIEIDSKISPIERKRIWVILVLGLGFHYILAALLPLTNDELYYWDWSSSLQWSYIDHPPMVGWLAGIVRFFLGEYAFSADLFPRFLSPLLHLGASVYLARLTGLWSEEADAFLNIKRCVLLTLLIPGL